MIGLVVTGHGHFADGIHTSAQMIAGENEYVRYINFEEGMSPEQLAEKFNAAFDEFRTCDGVVVLSDLPGGSPFKTAVECKYARPDQKIEVIAGTICRCSSPLLRCWIWKMIPALLQKNWLTPARIVW